MTTTTTFRHDALLYAGPADFVERTAAFVRAGLAADEAVAVAVIEPRAGALREELAADAGHVTWIDMERVGRNPARIIPAWQQWTREQGTRAFRGIGEPIWAGRSDAELVECRHHESLLNLAFDGIPWQLLCPYDTTALAPEVIDAVHASHPRVLDGPTEIPGAQPHTHDYAATLLGPALSQAPARAARLAFRAGKLAGVREFVRRHLPATTRARGNAAVLAIGEIAGNSIVHGGGHGTILLWTEDEHLVCEIHDTGHIVDPLAGRHRPTPDQHGARGLWIANQVCDLAQIRSTPAGTTVRLHLTL
ncbi:anti-sigma factor RsbA family regulatory protein [Embleya sp. NBC_00896]|uniref:anti-sigma factor RsbA family regulatory protein n=1 Tax=Embleya sp. NBC_00896 TaxID=2975961 RepID=UPI00386617DD|nr:anti-sigma factor RsbA family regulatory protein [Embleya sp. NBC_00896]